jgi:predicted PurR-regulated permease PerM
MKARMNILYKTRIFQATVWLLLLFLLILVGQQVSFIFRPVVVFITSIALPVLISGLLYYLLSPIVDRLVKWKLPKIIAILLIYLAFFGIIVFAVLFLGPLLQQQLISIVENAPRFFSHIHSEYLQLQDLEIFSRFRHLESIESWLNIDYAQAVDNVVNAVLKNIAGFARLVASSIIVVLTVPFILFYMLKDGHKLPSTISRYLPSNYREEGIEVLKEMSDTIRSYVQGQLIVSLFVGIFVFIGYLIVGLDYALLLALVTAVTNVIPYFGPIIGTIPGVIVGLMQSPWTALQVLVIMVIVQQLESQLVAPQVLGRKLLIHPIVIIFVLLTAGSLAGFLGLILGVPAFAIGRVIVSHIYKLIRKEVESNEKA